MSHSKILSFAKSFLSYLTKIRLDTRYLAFGIFLQMPKAVKVRKAITSHIITQADIKNVLRYIKRAEQEGKISQRRSLQYAAFILFGTYTGQRPISTISRLKVGQFRAALKTEKPVLLVKANQDKIRMEHYVPLCPQVVQAIGPLLDGRGDDAHVHVRLTGHVAKARAYSPFTDSNSFHARRSQEACGVNWRHYSMGPVE